MQSPLLDTLRDHAHQNGFDLFGVVDAQHFDATQPKERRLTSLFPGCGAVALVGRGGPRCDPAALGQGLRRLHGVAARALPRVVLAEPGRCAISFPRLAEAAGFGTVSPVNGMLLHPHYGPWVGVHAALLVEGNPFGSLSDAAISDRFQPCCKCRQSCLEVLQDPWKACGLGVNYRDAVRPPVQMAAVRTTGLSNLRFVVRRFVPRFFRT